MSVGCEESEPLSRVLLFDSDGYSDYTCYLARGISKFRQVVLYSFSEKSHIVTGASLEKNVKFQFQISKIPLIIHVFSILCINLIFLYYS